ncbi:ABC transporter permease [Craterilacuibacter sp. RT1T]|uniref:ABC transporter permease n=1 Tax=Craterilacuibacter sp. RT1T TaxID=2942211 RepID=UPI0020BE4BD6|nr:ABC transporter permease [Craterilacuibacter sp. RT1T]MCL6262919.1 ABC transporter permease [Craterilacuibacter sp. RT1T]
MPRTSPVILFLISAAWLAALGLPLLSIAPNRLLSGQGVSLAALLHGWRYALLVPALVLLAAPWLAACAPGRGLLLLGSAMLSFALLALCGEEAQWQSAQDGEGLLRVSFGGGFWLLQLLLWLLLAELLRGMRLRMLWLSAALAPLLWLLERGRLDALSLAQEYRNHQDSLALALGQHLALVVYSVLPAILFGSLLGLVAYRYPVWRKPLFSFLGVLQTIPSIALFALLIAPLAWLGAHWPQSGIAGVGRVPALVALTLYGLLPMARSSFAALTQIAPEVLEAGRGIGMSAAQLFFRAELPLALPVWLSGVRVTAVQTVGLGAVAALIGAGGFGSIMFQGLSSSALDLVLLGVIPLVLLALLLDVLFRLALSLLKVEP